MKLLTITLSGPQGCGKTRMAKIIRAVAGLWCCPIRIKQVQT